MSGSAAFSQRLAAFKENFKQILGRKHTGYDELSGLERPLVSHEDGQDDSFGQGAAPAGHYQGPVPGYEGANRYQAAHGGQAADSFTTATAVPSQVLAILVIRDAALQGWRAQAESVARQGSNLVRRCMFSEKQVLEAFEQRESSLTSQLSACGGRAGCLCSLYPTCMTAHCGA